MRQVLIAGLVTLVLSAAMILDPLDQFGWLVQSNLATKAPSGDIVYVGVDQDIEDPSQPAYRRNLARLIERLDEAGAEAVYVNLLFEQASEDPAADLALNDALEAFGENAYVTVRKGADFAGDSAVYRSEKTVTENVKQVVAEDRYSYLGVTWSMPFTSIIDGQALPSIAAEMAGTEGSLDETFPISYIFDFQDIPSFRSTNLLDENEADVRKAFAGKTVLIGGSWGADNQTTKVPGNLTVASSFVFIAAAETLKADLPDSFGPFAGFLITFILLLMVVGLRMNSGKRHIGYAVLLILLISLFTFGTHAGSRISVSTSVCVLLIYAGTRLRVKWQRKYALKDQLTKLPTFRALECDLTETENHYPLVVAEIHGFQAVLQALPPARHKDYILRLVERLSLGEEGKIIYANDGRHFAWLSTDTEVEAIREHLEGLRSLFSQPLLLDGTKLDVGVTFGVEISENPSASVRIATAMNAVEKTSEAHEFVIFDGTETTPDDLWDLSLRARIDTALERGEIFVVYQPQMSIADGRLVGLEALVRWNDPVKGLISPAYFVEQCEKAGRMDHLTRHVMDKAVADAAYLASIGIDIRMSVNISATLLNGDGVIAMAQEAVTKHDVATNRICLELTETAKIPNMDRTSLLLERLSSLGFRLSLDDFGVGEANIENLYRLPFDEMKIDKLFTRDLTSQKNRAILQSLVTLGRDACIDVVAEGIEDRKTLEFLKEIGCPFGQGYYLSYPLPLQKIVEYHAFARAMPIKYS